MAWSALARTSPAVQLLRSHMLSSFELAPHFGTEAGRHVELATISLAAAAISNNDHIPLEDDASAPTIPGVLTHQIKRHIRRNLGSENLSPQAIAREFGVSRAQIYRLMEPLGGVASYIRRLRLQHSMAALCDPLLAHQNISEIAYRSGFNHLTTFYRSFRETFGVSPKDAREKGGLFLQPTASTGTAKQHQEWIRSAGL